MRKSVLRGLNRFSMLINDSPLPTMMIAIPGVFSVYLSMMANKTTRAGARTGHLSLATPLLESIVVLGFSEV